MRKDLCGGQQDSASSNIDPLLGDLGDELGPNDDGVGQQHPLSEHLEAAELALTWRQMVLDLIGTRQARERGRGRNPGRRAGEKNRAGQKKRTMADGQERRVRRGRLVAARGGEGVRLVRTRWVCGGSGRCRRPPFIGGERGTLISGSMRMPETAAQGLAPRVRPRAREQEGTLELGKAGGVDHGRI